MAMRSVNRVTLLGRLEATPDCVIEGSRKAVCTFIVVTEESWMGREGPVSRVCRHRCVVFGPLASVVQRAQVGAAIYVEGALRDQLGAGASATSDEIVAFVVQPLAEQPAVEPEPA